MKKVLFLCGSPTGKKSASLYTALFLSRFLDYDYEFVDVTRARLSSDPTEADPAFLKIVEKMKGADAIIWTFGAWVLFVPVQMQYLLDKLFAQQGYDFTGRIAASVMTSARVHDDYILDKVRFVSEQLGFGYIGDISAEGNPFFGYVDDEETEDSCRVLAEKINRALENGYVPAKESAPLDRAYLSPLSRGKGFDVNGPEAEKDGNKTILVITGNRISDDPAAASIVESIRRYSRNKVELMELQDHKVGPCVGCLLCDSRVEGICVLKDEYEAIKRRIHKVDGIVYIGRCSSGMVDCHLKAFLDRSWGMAHRPSLKGRYSFAVAIGGGPLGKNAAWYLGAVLDKTGAKCIAALADRDSNDPNFANTVRQTVEDLDRAMEEKWQIADRFATRCATWTFRDLVAKNGMYLRADYDFHQKNRMFDYPSTGGSAAIMRILFKSKKLRNRLIAFRRNQITKEREKRLENFLKTGTIGKGKDITENR
ncbi:MAG: NAD(P)H-dependent oxidoreductase [Chloroflexi bacterium]|nr:NAD(P)H-dependent oxidoreductase [Chloroflexota bacterium]